MKKVKKVFLLGIFFLFGFWFRAFLFPPDYVSLLSTRQEIINKVDQCNLDGLEDHDLQEYVKSVLVLRGKYDRFLNVVGESVNLSSLQSSPVVSLSMNDLVQSFSENKERAIREKNEFAYALDAACRTVLGDMSLEDVFTTSIE